MKHRMLSDSVLWDGHVDARPASGSCAAYDRQLWCNVGQKESMNGGTRVEPDHLSFPSNADALACQ